MQHDAGASKPRGNDAFCVIGNAGEAKTREFILQQILMIKSQNTVICVVHKRLKDDEARGAF